MFFLLIRELSQNIQVGVSNIQTGISTVQIGISNIQISLSLKTITNRCLKTFAYLIQKHHKWRTRNV